MKPWNVPGGGEGKGNNIAVVRLVTLVRIGGRGRERGGNCILLFGHEMAEKRLSTVSRYFLILWQGFHYSLAHQVG